MSIDRSDPPDAVAERFAEIRARLEDGFYDRRPVLDLIAQRILRSGDLRPPRTPPDEGDPS